MLAICQFLTAHYIHSIISVLLHHHHKGPKSLWVLVRMPPICVYLVV